MEKTIIYFGNVLYPDLDAASHRTIGNAKALRELGYNVVLIGTRKGEIRPVLETKETFHGFDIYFFPDPETPKQWKDYLFGFKPLEVVFKTLKNVDSVILYNHPSISTKRALSFCHKHKVKVYADCTEWFDPHGFSIHTVIKKIDTWYRMQHANKHLDGIIAISSFLDKFYKEKGCKTICVPPLIDLTNEKWKVDPIRKEEDTDFVKLIYVGNPGAGEKDKLGLIISSLRKVHQANPNLHFGLDIIGMNEEQFHGVFHEDISDCSFVSFLGRKPNVEALAHIKGSDYTVFLRDNNLTCSAGFPTKFSEAMACGTPVLTNLSSDLGQYLINGKNGFILDKENLAKLCEGLVHALTVEKDQRKVMKEYCKSDKTFDYHSFIEDFKKMF